MRSLLGLGLALLLLGCGAPDLRPLPYDHPANPGARESFVAPISSLIDPTLADPIAPHDAAGAEQ